MDMPIGTSKVLDNLTDRERQIIMDVLKRDKEVRQRDSARIMVLRAELRALHREGAIKSKPAKNCTIASQSSYHPSYIRIQHPYRNYHSLPIFYGIFNTGGVGGDGSGGYEFGSRAVTKNICTGCQCVLGKFINRGALCPTCRLRVCKLCQKFMKGPATNGIMSTPQLVKATITNWVCVVCHQQMETQAASGEWMNEFNRDLSRRDSLTSDYNATPELIRKSIRRSWTISTPHPDHNLPTSNRNSTEYKAYLTLPSGEETDTIFDHRDDYHQPPQYSQSHSQHYINQDLTCERPTERRVLRQSTLPTNITHKESRHLIPTNNVYNSSSIPLLPASISPKQISPQYSPYNTDTEDIMDGGNMGDMSLSPGSKGMHNEPAPFQLNRNPVRRQSTLPCRPNEHHSEQMLSQLHLSTSPNQSSGYSPERSPSDQQSRYQSFKRQSTFPTNINYSYSDQADPSQSGHILTVHRPKILPTSPNRSGYVKSPEQGPPHYTNTLSADDIGPGGGEFQKRHGMVRQSTLPNPDQRHKFLPTSPPKHRQTSPQYTKRSPEVIRAQSIVGSGISNSNLSPNVVDSSSMNLNSLAVHQQKFLPISPRQKQNFLFPQPHLQNPRQFLSQQNVPTVTDEVPYTSSGSFSCISQQRDGTHSKMMKIRSHSNEEYTVNRSIFPTSGEGRRLLPEIPRNRSPSRLVRQEHVREERGSPIKRTFAEAKQTLAEYSMEHQGDTPPTSGSGGFDELPSFFEGDEDDLLLMDQAQKVYRQGYCGSDSKMLSNYGEDNIPPIQLDVISRIQKQYTGTVRSVENVVTETYSDVDVESFGSGKMGGRSILRKEQRPRRRRSHDMTEHESIPSSNDEEPRRKPEAMRSISEDVPPRLIKPLPRRALSHPEKDTQQNIKRTESGKIPNPKSLADTLIERQKRNEKPSKIPPPRRKNNYKSLDQSENRSRQPLLQRRDSQTQYENMETAEEPERDQIPTNDSEIQPISETGKNLDQNLSDNDDTNKPAEHKTTLGEAEIQNAVEAAAVVFKKVVLQRRQAAKKAEEASEQPVRTPPNISTGIRSQYDTDIISDCESVPGTTGLNNLKILYPAGTLDDYKLVFISSADSSSKEDELCDSSSTCSSANTGRRHSFSLDDCDWDYFEPGAVGSSYSSKLWKEKSQIGSPFESPLFYRKGTTVGSTTSMSYFSTLKPNRLRESDTGTDEELFNVTPIASTASIGFDSSSPGSSDGFSVQDMLIKKTMSRFRKKYGTMRSDGIQSNTIGEVSSNNSLDRECACGLTPHYVPIPVPVPIPIPISAFKHWKPSIGAADLLVSDTPPTASSTNTNTTDDGSGNSTVEDNEIIVPLNRDPVHRINVFNGIWPEIDTKTAVIEIDSTANLISDSKCIEQNRKGRKPNDFFVNKKRTNANKLIDKPNGNQLENDDDTNFIQTRSDNELDGKILPVPCMYSDKNKSIVEYLNTTMEKETSIIVPKNEDLQVNHNKNTNITYHMNEHNHDLDGNGNDGCGYKDSNSSLVKNVPATIRHSETVTVQRTDQHDLITEISMDKQNLFNLNSRSLTPDAVSSSLSIEQIASIDNTTYSDRNIETINMIDNNSDYNLINDKPVPGGLISEEICSSSDESRDSDGGTYDENNQRKSIQRSYNITENECVSGDSDRKEISSFDEDSDSSSQNTSSSTSDDSADVDDDDDDDNVRRSGEKRTDKSNKKRFHKVFVVNKGKYSSSSSESRASSSDDSDIDRTTSLIDLDSTNGGGIILSYIKQRNWSSNDDDDRIVCNIDTKSVNRSSANNDNKLLQDQCSNPMNNDEGNIFIDEPKIDTMMVDGDREYNSDLEKTMANNTLHCANMGASNINYRREIERFTNDLHDHSSSNEKIEIVSNRKEILDNSATTFLNLCDRNFAERSIDNHQESNDFKSTIPNSMDNLIANEYKSNEKIINNWNTVNDWSTSLSLVPQSDQPCNKNDENDIHPPSVVGSPPSSSGSDSYLQNDYFNFIPTPTINKNITSPRLPVQSTTTHHLPDIVTHNDQTHTDGDHFEQNSIEETITLPTATITPHRTVTNEHFDNELSAISDCEINLNLNSLQLLKNKYTSFVIITSSESSASPSTETTDSVSTIFDTINEKPFTIESLPSPIQVNVTANESIRIFSTSKSLSDHDDRTYIMDYDTTAKETEPNVTSYTSNESLGNIKDPSDDHIIKHTTTDHDHSVDDDCVKVNVNKEKIIKLNENIDMITINNNPVYENEQIGDRSSKSCNESFVDSGNSNKLSSESDNLIKTLTPSSIDDLIANENQSSDKGGNIDLNDRQDDVTIVTGLDTLSAVVCLEDGLADDDSWVEEISQDEDDFGSTTTQTATDSDMESGEEMTLCSTIDREEELRGYNRASIDFTLHTIVEESCEDSEFDSVSAHADDCSDSAGLIRNRKGLQQISPSELEKYFFYELGAESRPVIDNNSHRIDDDDDDDDDSLSEQSSIYSEDIDSFEPLKNSSRNFDKDDDSIKYQDDDNPDEMEDLSSSRLEKYFLSGFMGFSATDKQQNDSDGSGSVGSDSEGHQSPEQRRKRLVRARGTPRSHNSSLDNLLTATAISRDDNSSGEISGGTTTNLMDNESKKSSESDSCDDTVIPTIDNKTDPSDTLKRNKKQVTVSKKRTDTHLPIDLSTILNYDDSLAIVPSETGPTSTTKNTTTSRDSGFIGSNDDLLKGDDPSKSIENINLNITQGEPTVERIGSASSPIEDSPKIETSIKMDSTQPAHTSKLTKVSLSRRDSFNNWSSDEETNLMMSKMRQFFKTLVAASANAQNMERNANKPKGLVGSYRNPNQPDTVPDIETVTKKPAQLVYFENELTRLMKTVPGIKDEQVRELVEYLSSEDTWSDSYDSSDYTSSDLEGAGTRTITTNRKTELQEQISASCQQIIKKFDGQIVSDEEGDLGDGGVLEDNQGLNHETALVYQRLVASFSKMATVNDPIVQQTTSGTVPVTTDSPPLFSKVISHIGTRLVALMHEVSSGESPVSRNSSPKQIVRPPIPSYRKMKQQISATTTEDDDDENDASIDYLDANLGAIYLPRSKSHDLLLSGSGNAARLHQHISGSGSIGNEPTEEKEASDYERFSWRGSFESALLANGDSRTKLSSLERDINSSSASALAAKRRSAGDLLFNQSNSMSREQLDRVRSCGSIGTGGGGSRSNVNDDLLNATKSWGSESSKHRVSHRRRSSVPDSTGGCCDSDSDISDNDRYSGRSTLPRSLQQHNMTLGTTSSLPRLSTTSSGYSSATVAMGSSSSNMISLSSISGSSGLSKPQSSYHFLPNSVKSARYRPPGFNRLMPKKAISTPGLHSKHDLRQRTLSSYSEEAASASATSELIQTPLPGHRNVSANKSGSGDLKSPSTELQQSPTVATGPSESWTIQSEEDIDRLVAMHQNRSSLSSLGLRSDSMVSVYSGAGDGRYGTVAVKGQVEFGMQYNYKQSALEVHVVQCKDLAAVDSKRNRSDPYVKLYLLPDKSKSGKRKTKVKKHTLNPVFDETLKFYMSLKNLESRTLWLTVWHSDMFGRNDFLGEIRINLQGKVFDDPHPQWYLLQERSEPFEELTSYQGDIIVGLKFIPPEALRSSSTSSGTTNSNITGSTIRKFGSIKSRTASPSSQQTVSNQVSRGALHVLIKEAKNLNAVKANGSCDAFCKSYLLPDKNRSSKQKTAVVKRTTNPSWNHTFVYDDVSLSDLSERALELTLWDHDRLASNEFLGGVRFSLGTGKHYGKTVDWMDSVGKELSLWQNMLNRPNFWVEGSLILRPSLDGNRFTT